ncbi:MAG: cobalt-precorrin-5B (C(1))-methyltransferase CbiD [Clostridium sp.]|nr:cobalt-precorrin-5B (C(1))-methyltransferase CbiD [Clostridium sp.]
MKRNGDKSMEERMKELRHANPKDLREGVTTGTCAAAAAAASAAALMAVMAGKLPYPVQKSEVFPIDSALPAVSDRFGKDALTGAGVVSITTPGGKTVDLEIVRQEFTEAGGVRSTVIKDAGDDPDVTDQAEICAEVLWIERTRLGTPEEKLRKQEKEFIPVYMDPKYPGLALTGGEGVGICTRKGLPDPVGFPAINPVPRSMILKEVYAVAEHYAEDRNAMEQYSAMSASLNLSSRDMIHPASGNDGSPEPGGSSVEKTLLIRISIPKGRELAEKTFNPKLGIVGGLSVLGTTGIVHPMSEDALIRTVELEISVRSAEGRSVLAIAPGNYGRQYLHDKTGLDMEHFVKCSNYVGQAFRMLDRVGVKNALFAGHPGKLIKVAGGILNTHSKYGDHRMEIMADCAMAVGASAEMCRRILALNTTNEASEYLDTVGLRDLVYAEAALRVKSTLEAISHARVEVMFLDGERGLLAQTDGTEELVRILSEEEKTIYG